MTICIIKKKYPKKNSIIYVPVDYESGFIFRSTPALARLPIVNGVKFGEEEIEMMEKRNQEKVEGKKAEKIKADEDNMENVKGEVHFEKISLSTFIDHRSLCR